MFVTHTIYLPGGGGKQGFFFTGKEKSILEDSGGRFDCKTVLRRILDTADDA